MSEWKEINLEDFWHFNPKVETQKDIEYSFIEMPDLIPGEKEVYPKRKRKPHGLTKFQNGDTLFAKITPCLENGKICQAKGLENNVGVGSTEFFVFRGKDNISDNDFVYYLLKWYPITKHAISCMSGSAGHQRVPSDVFKNFSLRLPELSEQIQIAKTLSSLDSKITLLRQQNQILEELAQTLFKRWFVDFEFPDENGQPYKSSGGKMIDSELGEIPEGWRVIPLDELVIVHNGYSYKGSELQESDVAMVTLKNFDRNGGFRFDGFKEIVSSNYKEKHIVQVGDLVVAHTDLTQDAEVLGNPAIIMKNDKYRELIISMDLVKVESQDPNINSEFLYFLMAEKRFKSHCKGYSNGTTVLHLSKNAIPEYLFPMPISSDAIVLFSNYAKTVYAKIIKNISEIQNVTNLRDTLLPKLMSGEMRVRN
jgi:type I restriction enzyme S subunit